MSKFRNLIENVLLELSDDYNNWRMSSEKADNTYKQIIQDLTELGYPSFWIKKKLTLNKVKESLRELLQKNPDFEIPTKFNSLEEVANFAGQVIPNQADYFKSIAEKYAEHFNTIHQRLNTINTDENIDSEGAVIENPEEVKKFMQGSVAVDKAGRPIALYIGTENPVEKQFDFKHKRSDSYSKQNAIFTTRRKDIADEYRNYVKDGKYQRNPNTLSKVYVSLKNPVIADFKGALFRGINTGYNGYMYTGYTDDDEDWINVTDMQGNHLQSFSGSAKVPAMNQIVSFAKKNGYDGIIAKNVDDFRRDPKYSEVVYSDLPYGNDEYIAFNPKQIMIVNQE